MSDFSGWDDISASALETDLFDAMLEVDGLDVDGLADGLPDPIEGADDIAVGSQDVAGYGAFLEPPY